MRRRDLFALPFALPAQNAHYLTGTADLPGAPLELKAGPLSVLFEPGLGFVRYVRFGEHEVLRGIYAAVRDKSWGTVTPQVSNLKTTTSPSGFMLDFDVLCQEGDIDFAWHGTVSGEAAASVSGEAAGTLRFHFAGQARSNFERNRIGFCVLHPLAECAGQPLTAELADGTMTTGKFPDMISPHQPFVNLRALSHQLPDGSKVEVRFAGDIFEMEDHRNWSDGNYKTYCTPLALPFPAKVERGQKIEQSISVRLTPAASPPRARQNRGTGIVELTAGPATGKLPSLGFGMAAHEPPLGPREASLLTALKPQHLRVDLNPGGDWRGLLSRAQKEAMAVGARLEIAVMLGDNPEAELQALAKEAVRPARWLIFQHNETVTKPGTIALARRILKGPVASGTNQYFTELNRERPALSALDAVCYSVNPQVHAFDNVSLVENLSPQGDQVRSARQFCGTKPIAVTPITLRPRFNPQQRGPEPPPAPGKLPARIDHRQTSLFAAAWTLGSVKYLAEAGAASATYYETHGWGGLLLSGPSPLPGVFRAEPNAVFAMYHLFADLAEFAGGSWRQLNTDDPLAAVGLELMLGSRRRILIANLTAQPRIVRVPAGTRMALRTLAESNYAFATTSPLLYRRGGQTLTTTEKTMDLPLGAYAVATLDG